MKSITTILASFIIFLISVPLPVFTEDGGSQGASMPLCLPGVYNEVPAGCQVLGPSEYLTRWATAGITFPITHLPAQPLDESFSELPFDYVKIQENNVLPVYTSLEDAIGKVNPHHYIDKGLVFVSYIQRTEKYYMIDQGIWIRGGDTAGGAALSPFRGLRFAGTPEHKFGWIMSATETQREPGSSNPRFTGHTLNRYDVVQVYDTRDADGVKWYLIGPDEWVEGHLAALVYPSSAPPEGVMNWRWIEINLYEQTVSVYENNHLVFATLVSTGVDGWWTRPGLFQVFEKLQSTPMMGAFESERSDYYHLEDVPWTMYYDEKRALHGAYWHNFFGYKQSHGCANLSPGDARWLYEWAQLGDYVYVWDPSGETPTDPSLYKSGAP